MIVRSLVMAFLAVTISTPAFGAVIWAVHGSNGSGASQQDISPTSATLLSIIGVGLSDVHDVEILPDGNLVVANDSAHYRTVSPTGTHLTNVFSTGIGNRIGLELDASGAAVYSAHSSFGGAVRTCSTSTGACQSLTAITSTQRLADIEVLGSGNILAADSLGVRLQEIDPITSALVNSFSIGAFFA